MLVCSNRRSVHFSSYSFALRINFLSNHSLFVLFNSGTTESDCNSHGAPYTKFWLENGAVTDGSIARWGACTSDIDGCAPGLRCKSTDRLFAFCIRSELTGLLTN